MKKQILIASLMFGLTATGLASPCTTHWADLNERQVQENLTQLTADVINQLTKAFKEAGYDLTPEHIQFNPKVTSVYAPVNSEEFQRFSSVVVTGNAVVTLNGKIYEFAVFPVATVGAIEDERYFVIESVARLLRNVDVIGEIKSIICKVETGFLVTTVPLNSPQFVKQFEIIRVSSKAKIARTSQLPAPHYSYTTPKIIEIDPLPGNF